MTAPLDPHAHLTQAPTSAELEAVLGRAAAAGVFLVINASAQIGDFAKSPVPLGCRKNGGEEKKQNDPKSVRIWSAFGIHPWYTRQTPPDWEQTLCRALDESEMPLIGEIGLDYGPKGLVLAPKDVQRPLFERQLEIADELGIPAVVHASRTAGEAFETARAFPHIPCLLFHGYLEPLSHAKIEKRFFFSFSPREAGSERRKGREKIRQLAKFAPEQILAESDYPACGQEPAGIPQTMELLEELGARPFAAANRFLDTVQKR